MKTLLYTISFILSIAPSYAQKNLVPDSSFEEYNYLPTQSNYLAFPSRTFNKLLPNWYAPTNGVAVYFNKLCTYIFNTIPYNNIYINSDSVKHCVNYQDTRTGNGYCGFVYQKGLLDMYNHLNSYLQTEFIEPLQKNKIYRVSFYVNRNGCSYMAVSNIGAYITNNYVRQYYKGDSIGEVDINYTNFATKIEPQIVLKDSVISDTVNWIRIHGLYKAKGGEKWITIGHFNDTFEKRIVYDTLSKYSIAKSSFTFYYLEDVSVYETQSVIFPDTACLGENIVFTSTFKAPFEWYSGSTLLSTDSIYNFKASQSGYYILKSKNRIDTFYLTVLNTQFSLGKDTFICNGKSIKLQVPIAFNSYLWHTGEKSSFINVTKGGLYSVMATNKFGCTYTDSIYIERKPDNYKNELQYINEYCTDDSIYTTIQLSNNYTYKWLNDNDTNTLKKLYHTGCYPIAIKDTFGCSLQDDICLELCPSVFNVPNAFVPNGVNSIFKPVGSNIKDITMTIFNRWGEIMYKAQGKNIGWNGTFEDSYCPTGIYIYIITYTTYDKSQAETLKGVLELLR